MRKILKSICIVLLLFSFFPSSVEVSAQVTAEDSPNDNKAPDMSKDRRTKNNLVVKEACPRFMGDEEMYDKIDDFRESRATIQEEYALGMMEWFWNLFGLNTLNQLIFGNPYCIWFEGDEPAAISYGLFPQELKEKVVDPMHDMFSGLFFILLMLAMMIAGLRMSTSFIGKSNFSIIKELHMYFIAAFLLVAYWLGIDKLFVVNFAIVSSLQDVLVNQGLTLGEVAMVAGVDKFHFLDIIIMLAEWFIMLFLNIVYIFRVFLLTLLLATGGLSIVLLVFERTRGIFKMWLLTFVGTVFMQSVHALYYTAIMLFVSLNEASFLMKLILLILFLPMSSMMLGMMQMSEGNLAAAGGQRMVNAMAIAQRVAGKTSNRGSQKNKLGDMANGQVGKTRISALASGGSGWNIAKNTAKIAGSLSGAVAGSVIGAGGVSLGASFTGSAVGAAIQTPRNVAASIKGVVETQGQFKQANISENIGERRAYFGQMGESLGTMFGAGEVGRKVGNALSGVSSARLLQSDELGGFGGVTMQDILTKYPGAEIQFQQTNEGSAFFVMEGNEYRPISPIGAADTNLPDGLMRTIDYQSNVGFDTTNPSQMHHQSSLLSQVGDVTLRDQAGGVAADLGFNAGNIRHEDYYAAGIENSIPSQLSERIADKVSGYKGSEERT